MAKKKLLASMALAGGLVVGGAAGMVLGGPGVSGAQTTTVPAPTTPSAPTTPGIPGTPAPDGTHKNCPHMGQAPDGSTPNPAPSNSNTGFSRSSGRV